jgi:hypothetical protein
MSGKTSRTKGFSYERLIANHLKQIGYPKARRKLEYQTSDELGIDLEHVGIYDIQCKRLKKYASITMIEEVPAREGRIPVLITKGDNKPSMAVIPLEHFLELVRVKE